MNPMHDELKRLAADLAADKLFHGGVVQISEGLYFRILAALAEDERLREALEPFATALDDWGDDTGQPDRWNTWEHPIAMNVTLGDFRRARSALTAGASHAD